jgi:hypothetical protein
VPAPLTCTASQRKVTKIDQVGDVGQKELNGGLVGSDLQPLRVAVAVPPEPRPGCWA